VNNANIEEPEQFPEKAPRTQIAVPLTERYAYTPKEFAALFGRQQTWGYRQLYSGRIKAIRNLRRLMIPRSEAERLTRELMIHGNAGAE